MTRSRLASALLCCLIIFNVETAFGQQGDTTPGSPPVLSTTPTPPLGAVPQPGSMSGLPLQVGDLPPGTIAVRVIRGNFSNNVVNHPVELRVGSQTRPQTTATGQDGRAVFTGLAVGGEVQAATTLDGQHLESQRFEIPALGGVRLVLVGGGGAGEDVATALPSAGEAVEPPNPAPGAQPMTFGGKLGIVAGMWAVAVGAFMAFRRRKPAAVERPRAGL